MRRAAIAATVRAVVLVVLLAAPPAWSADAPAGDTKDPGRAITSQLICPCSCGEVLSGCTCETGVALKAYVDDELKAGKDKDAIEAALIAKYGEVILGAPKAKGFNLIVWIAPFAATLVGFAIASMVLVRWVRGRRVALAAANSGAAPTDSERSLDALRARAEAELRELKE